MKKSSIFIAAMLVLVIVCIGLVACNPKDESKQSSILVVGTTMTVDTLNRLDTSGSATGGYYFDKIASSVSQIAAVSKIDGEYVGVDCDYALSEDGKTLMLTQKDGYKWHDGETVTIDDVEFTLKDLKAGEDYESIKKIGNSLVYELCTPSYTFLAKVSDKTVMPKHLLDGKTKDTVTDEQSVVGAGPFKFSSIDKAAGTITFEKFADYPKANAVKFDKVIFKQYGNQEVLTLALKNGEIDLAFDYGKGLTSDQISALSSQSDIKLVSQATKQVPKVMFFNNQKMTNANVKRAIALSIDYDKIRSTFASAGAAPSREGFVGEGIFGYKETPVWTRNLEKAKELLTSEGYSQSNKFRFELLVRAGSDDTQYASLLKTQIEESGLVDVVLVEKGSDWQEYYQAGNHMASLAKITAKGYDFEAGYGTRYTLATNTSMLDMKNPVAHGQLLVEDEHGLTEYGKILYAMKNAATSEELTTAVGEYQDYVVKNVICVALFYDGTTYGASAKLDGFKLDSASGILNPSTFETLVKH
ncbi:MAG TPA: hypothetical protein DCS37_02410 [Clostridiales bacterium]|nr:hypothetical protein [Clostridiales bacterium]